MSRLIISRRQRTLQVRTHVGWHGELLQVGRVIHDIARARVLRPGKFDNGPQLSKSWPEQNMEGNLAMVLWGSATLLEWRGDAQRYEHWTVDAARKMQRASNYGLPAQREPFQIRTLESRSDRALTLKERASIKQLLRTWPWLEEKRRQRRLLNKPQHVECIHQLTWFRPVQDCNYSDIIEWRIPSNLQPQSEDSWIDWWRTLLPNRRLRQRSREGSSSRYSSIQVPTTLDRSWAAPWSNEHNRQRDWAAQGHDSDDTQNVPQPTRECRNWPLEATITAEGRPR